jgi:hypothetical protein
MLKNNNTCFQALYIDYSDITAYVNTSRRYPSKKEATKVITGGRQGRFRKIIGFVKIDLKTEISFEEVK